MPENWIAAVLHIAVPGVLMAMLWRGFRARPLLMGTIVIPAISGAILLAIAIWRTGVHMFFGVQLVTGYGAAMGSCLATIVMLRLVRRA